MTKLEQAARQALEALIAATPVKAKDPQMQADAIVALREALEQPDPAELAKQGWQVVECPICGDSARAFPEPAQSAEIKNQWALRDVYFDEGGEPTMHKAPEQPAQHKPSECRKSQTISGDYVCDCRIGECPRNEDGRIVSECAHPTDDGLGDQQSPSPRGVGETIIQPAQEPVAWMGAHDSTDLYYRKPPQADVIPLYTRPQQRAWVSLTDEEIEEINVSLTGRRDLSRIFVRAIEAALRERNT